MSLQFTHTVDALPSSHLLGLASTDGCSIATDYPVQTLHMKPWEATQQPAPLVECWFAETPCVSGRYGQTQYRYNESLLFGVIELDEASVAQTSPHPLQQLAETAYLQIFQLLEKAGFPHIWRIWNYLPRINEIEQGTERYRWFNIGRHEAFSQMDREVAFSPAACALGTPDGPLSIAFLAAKIPTMRIENPRQVSAFQYPREYGAKSPTFTRAAIAPLASGAALFISGTASIVNHETMHLGDIVGQTKETLTNIQTLIQEANQHLGATVFLPENFYYKVYVRQAAHFAFVHEILQKQLGSAHVQYVQADVCRRDLLVEIEAHALAPIPLAQHVSETIHLVAV